MKKLISLVLALAMIMVVGAAFATQPTAESNTIEITNAVNGETYKAYKMLDLSYSGDDGSGNPVAYTYTVNSAWRDFFKAENRVVADVFEFDSQGYVTSAQPDEISWNATSKLSIFAEAAAKYAKENGLTPEVFATAGATGATLNTDAGYYLITSTLGSRAMVDTTPGNVTINEKNDVDSIEKEVKEDSTGNYGSTNDAQIGDKVEFKTIATITPRSVNVKIHDTMSAGLTFNNDIKIYKDAGLTTELTLNTQYTIQTTPDTGDTFTIAINDSVAADTSATQELYITYSATLNKDAITSTPGFAEIKNTTTITFGDSQKSTEASTTTTTHSFSIHKHKKGETASLAGAEFQLKKGTGTDATVLSLVQIDQEGLNYRIAESGETDAVTSFTTVAGGDIVIWGVDADSDYALEEKNPPEGFHKLSGDVTVAVDAANTTKVDVENNSGTELPSTGGIGTTIFYVVGGILLLGAAIVLVARRKANN